MKNSASRRLFALALVFATASTAWAEIEVEQQDDRVIVTTGGQPFAEYLTFSGAKPILWPVHGPGGAALTRGYPMVDKGELERDDHVHHRSFWFTHGDVNGVDFWLEGDHGGKTLHDGFVEVGGGETGVIVTRNNWVAPSGELVCRDERRLVFRDRGDVRLIDYDVTMTAPDDQDVTFGDTKEGTFGVRMAGGMKEEAELGGQAISSRGVAGAGPAWGKPAEWIDYCGPVDGETYGIAILNHPSSFRYPTRWHVREYGLFAANVFGLHDFERNPEADGSHTVPAGESIVFRHRVVLHRGSTEDAKIADLFAEYAAEER